MEEERKKLGDEWLKIKKQMVSQTKHASVKEAEVKALQEKVRILRKTQLKTLEKEMAMVRADLSKSQDRAGALDADVVRLAVENSKLKDEVKKINIDAKELRSNFVRSQGRTNHPSFVIRDILL